MWDLIVSIPDHCLSFYFSNSKSFYKLYIFIGLEVYFLSKQFNSPPCLQQLTRAASYVYTVWPWNNDMIETCVRKRVVKTRNKIVPKIRLKFAMFS